MMMEMTLSTLEQRYRVATPGDMKEIVHQGNYERPIALLNLVTKFICPLVSFIIPQYTLIQHAEDVLLAGFSRGNHTPMRARIRVVGPESQAMHHFEFQSTGPWHSPFQDGNPVSLYILAK
jgi:hypothetical protein